MRPILTPEQMQASDRTAMEHYGIPSLVLMENAARSAAEILRMHYPDASRVVILCGSGNNGGDGFALARHLVPDVDVRIIFCGKQERMSTETATNARICQRLGVPVVEWGNDRTAEQFLNNTDLVVDALLGIGASGAPRQPLASLIDAANTLTARRVALDIPTGLDASTGRAHQPCFHAERTITMGALKTGLFLADAPDVVGHLDVASIGIPHAVLETYATAWLLDEEDLRRTHRRRNPRTTKFDYGRVLVIAGSDAMPGAAALCANAAVAAGAGLVELITPRLHSTLFPEVMPHRYNRPLLDADALPLITERMQQANVVVIGPGLGAAPQTTALVQVLLERSVGRCALLLDADALRAIDGKQKLPNVTLTPHRREFLRMVGTQGEHLSQDVLNMAVTLSKQTDATIVLKDFPIQISDGRRSLWFARYNPALASGGTGDVLSGIIAAMWAQGYAQLEAAWMGVLLHAMAGAVAAQHHGELSTRASHILESLGDVSRLLSAKE
jgi:NAD(P)H-hydrate epimerase